jgi:hypothetical protein
MNKMGLLAKGARFSAADNMIYILKTRKIFIS